MYSAYICTRRVIFSSFGDSEKVLSRGRSMLSRDVFLVASTHENTHISGSRSCQPGKLWSACCVSPRKQGS